MIKCRPTQGFYKEGHPECEKCCRDAKRICMMFNKFLELDFDKHETDRKAKDETESPFERFRREL